MNQRLLELADLVEGYEEFDQSDNDHCTISLAERMIEQETGREILYGAFGEVSRYFDISVEEVDALFVGDFGDLDIGMENCADMDDVTREQAAEALRRLATDRKVQTPNDTGVLSEIDDYLINNNLL